MPEGDKKHYGVINIGTLKAKCLVAYFDETGKMVPQYWSNRLTCFGCEMMENRGVILEKNLETTLEEILRLKNIVGDYGGCEISLFATHALRDAKNKDQVIKKIKAKTGFDVEVIDTQKEGELYFKAVLGDFKSNKDYAVVDMGGGSCQVLIGNRDKIKENFSFETGAQFLHEKFTKDPHNPASFNTKEDLTRIREHLNSKYSVLKREGELPLIYGSSNIIDLLKTVKIDLEPHQDSLKHPYKTYPQCLEEFVSHIIKFPFSKRDEMYPFQKGYMWGIDKAFLNIIQLCEKFNSPYIVPTNASILEGFLYEMRNKSE